MYKVKVLVLGPCQSGKTTISNFLSDATETSSAEYHPTQGCRILEFENNVNVNGRNVTAEVELWDVSGDQKFESCWPAIAKDANGVVFVLNPDQPNHDKILETWHDYFVPNCRLLPQQCIILTHNVSKDMGSKPNLSETMKNIQIFNTSIDEDGETLRSQFTSFLSNLLTTMSDKSEQEELGILNSK